MLGHWLVYFVSFMLLSDIGTRYDLDFKSPQKSGQNFKSAEDMIELYKTLCAGKSVFFTFLCIICRLIQLSLYWILSFLSQFVEYPVVSIEDPFDKEDWEHIKYFSSLGICQVWLLKQFMLSFNLNAFNFAL